MNRELKSTIKLLSLALVTLTFAATAVAQGAAKHLPLSAFLDTQGSQNIYIPPVPDYWGWTAPPPGVKTPASSYVGGNGGSCDYAGLANEWLVQNGYPDLGTAFAGSVTTRSLADGRMQVQVELHTVKALTFGFRITTPEFGDFAIDPLIFGARAQDVLAGTAPPALGECHASFAWKQMPGPLVDFNHAWDEPGFEIVNISFRANAQGLLADGRPGRLIISQSGFFRTTGMGATSDGFPAEFVEVRATGH
jgi:hypothetical protein